MFEKKFLMYLLCLAVLLSLSAPATRGANILFVSSMTAEADDALKAFMEGLGHTVTYIDDDDDEATTEAAAAAADLVYISESVGSGGIKNEITEVEVPMIVGEPYAWDEMGLSEGSGGDEAPVTTDIEIIDPGHYLAAGLSGTVAVLTEILEGCNLGKGVTGPEATVIATATLSDGVTYDVIFVYEKGAALPVAPADGSAQVAADIRIGYGFHANCYPLLSEDAYTLLGAAVDYALGMTGPSGPVNPGDDGLVASYALDGDANDSSGNEHNGTAVGEPAFVEGQVGMALDFDGTDDVVELGKFDVVGGITLAAWIKADDFEINDARIITKANEWSGDSHWWMVSTISETSLRFRLKTDEGPTTATLVSDPVLEAGVFAHVAATWDGSTMRLYKDGVEVASQEKGGTAVAVDPDISVAIGSQPSDAFASDPSHVAKFFDGLIDDVRIYDRALSEGELLYLAGARAMPVDPGTDGLAAFYALENDVLDGSGNSNDGNIVGAPTFVDGLAGYGMAMEFDGESYVDVGNDASLDIPGPISMGLWIRPGADDPEGQGTATAPMAKADAGASPSWSWQVRYGWNSPQPYMAFTFNTSPRAWAYVGQNLEKDEWAHIACSHDGETLKCYLDGEETDSTPMGAITSSPAPVLIGSDGWRSDWIGALDEVAIYSRALSDGEIRYLAGIRENLALNPSFEEDEPVLDDPDWYSWATWNPAEGAGSNATIVDTDAVDGARSLRIEPVGVENWHFIVLNQPITVEMDKNYTTSFWAKADAPRPLTVQIKAEDNSISAWGATAFDLTTEWAEYSYTSEVLIDVIKVEFLCAGVEVPFLLDLVSVSEE
jgi:hypothetical protein